MAFIEARQSLRDHRKVLALATALDMPEAHVAGHCIFLWLWCLDNAEDGVLPASHRIIERAAGWHGGVGALVAALIEVGMLDQGPDGGLIVHHWWDYAGRLIEKRQANTERMRAKRADAEAAERATHVQRTSDARAGATLTAPHTTALHTTEQCAPAERVAAAAAPARAPRPVEVAGSEPGTARAAPKPNKLGDVVDAVKAAGGAVTTSARDGKAVKECSAPAQLIADAYLAASRGEWGDDFTRRNLALWFVCSRIDGYRAHAAQARASPGDATSRFQGGKYGRLVQA